MRGIASNQNKLSYYYGGREETARALAILIPPLALFTLWKQRRAASVCQETEASGGLFSLLSSEVALWLRSPGEQQLCPGGQICFSDRPWPPRYSLVWEKKKINHNTRIYYIFLKLLLKLSRL